MKEQLNLWAVCGVVALAANFTGCATIATGTSQKMRFNSTPEGATVKVDGKTIGETPLTARLKKKKEQEVVFSKDGYKTVTTKLESRVNGWFWGNILIGGLFGSTTDSASGALYEYAPSKYLVTMVPDEAAALESSTMPSMEAKIREFIIVNHREIQLDLARGEGETLSSLYRLLDIPAARESETLEKLRAVAIVHEDAPSFADQVMLEVK